MPPKKKAAQIVAEALAAWQEKSDSWLREDVTLRYSIGAAQRHLAKVQRETDDVATAIENAVNARQVHSRESQSRHSALRTASRDLASQIVEGEAELHWQSTEIAKLREEEAAKRSQLASRQAELDADLRDTSHVAAAVAAEAAHEEQKRLVRLRQAEVHVAAKLDRLRALQQPPAAGHETAQHVGRQHARPAAAVRVAARAVDTTAPLWQSSVVVLADESPAVDALREATVLDTAARFVRVDPRPATAADSNAQRLPLDAALHHDHTWRPTLPRTTPAAHVADVLRCVAQRQGADETLVVVHGRFVTQDIVRLFPRSVPDAATAVTVKLRDLLEMLVCREDTHSSSGRISVLLDLESSGERGTRGWSALVSDRADVAPVALQHRLVTTAVDDKCVTVACAGLHAPAPLTLAVAAALDVATALAGPGVPPSQPESYLGSWLSLRDLCAVAAPLTCGGLSGSDLRLALQPPSWLAHPHRVADDDEDAAASAADNSDHATPQEHAKPQAAAPPADAAAPNDSAAAHEVASAEQQPEAGNTPAAGGDATADAAAVDNVADRLKAAGVLDASLADHMKAFRMPRHFFDRDDSATNSTTTAATQQRKPSSVPQPPVGQQLAALLHLDLDDAVAFRRLNEWAAAPTRGADITALFLPPPPRSDTATTAAHRIVCGDDAQVAKVVLARVCAGAKAELNAKPLRLLFGATDDRVLIDRVHLVSAARRADGWYFCVTSRLSPTTACAAVAAELELWASRHANVVRREPGQAAVAAAPLCGNPTTTGAWLVRVTGLALDKSVAGVASWWAAATHLEATLPQTVCRPAVLVDATVGANNACVLALQRHAAGRLHGVLPLRRLDGSDAGDAIADCAVIDVGTHAAASVVVPEPATRPPLRLALSPVHPSVTVAVVADVSDFVDLKSAHTSDTYRSLWQHVASAQQQQITLAWRSLAAKLPAAVHRALAFVIVPMRPPNVTMAAGVRATRLWDAFEFPALVVTRTDTDARVAVGTASRDAPLLFAGAPLVVPRTADNSVVHTATALPPAATPCNVRSRRTSIFQAAAIEAAIGGYLAATTAFVPCHQATSSEPDAVLVEASLIGSPQRRAVERLHRAADSVVLLPKELPHAAWHHELRAAFHL